MNKYLVLENQGERAHPVDVLDDIEERKRVTGEIAIYEMKGDFPPKLKLVWHGKQTQSIRSKEM